MCIADEYVVLEPLHEVEVLKGGVVATSEEGMQGMEFDLPLMEEANDGNENIPEIQDDCFSLPNLEEIRLEERRGERRGRIGGGSGGGGGPRGGGGSKGGARAATKPFR